MKNLHPQSRWDNVFTQSMWAIICLCDKSWYYTHFYVLNALPEIIIIKTLIIISLQSIIILIFLAHNGLLEDPPKIWILDLPITNYYSSI